MLKTRLSLMVTVAITMSGLSPLSDRAHAASASNRVRTAQQALNTAQTKLNGARQALDKAQQDLGKTQSALQTASNQVHHARLSAAQKHGAEIGMTAAIAERDAATHRINERRKVLEAELKKRSDYQAAERDTDAARQRLSELPDDKSLTDEQREKSASELAARIRRPTEMHKEVEDADQQMQQAKQDLQAAGKKIAALQPQVKKAIDSDPAVTKAVEQEKQAVTALEKARTGSTRAEQDFNTAQGHVDRQNEQLAAAMAQSRRRR